MNRPIFEQQAMLYPCGHCNGSGNCSSGSDGGACAYCVKHLEMKKGSHRGLPCAVCGGLGQAELLTERMKNRAPMFLAIVTVFGLLCLIAFAVYRDEHLSVVLAFAGPLLGGIVGEFRQRPRAGLE